MPSCLERTVLVALVPVSLFALAGHVGAGAPQDPTGGEEAADSRADPDPRALARILHLRGGRALRAIARPRDGTWEYKRGGAWQTLPTGSVERVALEREVLAELRARRDGVAETDLAARVGVAGWMIEAGLLGEAVGELDAVLAVDGDQVQARELLLAHARAFGALPPRASDAEPLAAGLEPLLRFAAQAPPSIQEIAVLELAKERDRDGVLDLLSSELVQRTIGRRTFATLALRRLYPGAQLEGLLQRAVLDSAEPVRRGASLALASAEEPAVVAPVARAMDRSPSQRVRLHATEALGRMGYRAAVPALVARLAAIQDGGGPRPAHSNIFVGTQRAYIQDYDVEVAAGSAVADPQINVLTTGAVLDVAVSSVRQVQFAGERRAIRSALGQITGADPGAQSRDWLRWWDENAASWEHGE